MLKVVIFGAECTGKTTLAQRLSRVYGTLWVPEYSRTYARKKCPLTIEDVLPIMRGQLAFERAVLARAEQLGKNVLIFDTMPLSSLVYSQYYNNAVPDGLEALCTLHYDVYFLATDVPWEDDTVRGTFVDRQYMRQLFIDALASRGIPYISLEGDREKRLQQARQCIDSRL